MKITLTPQQKQQLEQMHDNERDSRVCDRLKAVLLASENWSQVRIAQALRIHESTVARHLSDYVLSEKLKPENGGSQSKLSATQTIDLIDHLTEKTYSHTHQIVAYVKETFGLDYTVSGMNKWLHHNGFSYKQPKGTPHKLDEAKQQAFIEAYEALKASCEEDESIVFIDAVHPTLSTKLSHGWIRTGQDKTIETTGNRSRLNIIGALNLADIGATIVHHYESINSETIVRFFCELRNSYPLVHKLHIILDGAGVTSVGVAMFTFGLTVFTVTLGWTISSAYSSSLVSMTLDAKKSLAFWMVIESQKLVGRNSLSSYEHRDYS